jgi:hypothetical protein
MYYFDVQTRLPISRKKKVKRPPLALNDVEKVEAKKPVASRVTRDGGTEGQQVRERSMPDGDEARS